MIQANPNFNRSHGTLRERNCKRSRVRDGRHEKMHWRKEFEQGELAESKTGVYDSGSVFNAGSGQFSELLPHNTAWRKRAGGPPVCAIKRCSGARLPSSVF